MSFQLKKIESQVHLRVLGHSESWLGSRTEYFYGVGGGQKKKANGNTLDSV